MISLREKKKRKNKKELASFRNKMGENLIWFDSLTLKKQYDLLFEWKKKKYEDKAESPKILKIKRYNYQLRKRETIELVVYPASLKHFIKSRKKSSRFRPTLSNKRAAVINILFNES